MCTCVSIKESCSACSSTWRCSSSFEFFNSFTMFSWLMLSPAPLSTSLLRLVISSFKCWIVSFALFSFSWDIDTNFHVFSISFCNWLIVCWSSWDNLKAVLIFAWLFTISVFNSRHFFTRRFSWSCDFFNALWSFSYSRRNFSRLWSPMSSDNT